MVDEGTRWEYENVESAIRTTLNGTLKGQCLFLSTIWMTQVGKLSLRQMKLNSSRKVVTSSDEIEYVIKLTAFTFALSFLFALLKERVVHSIPIVEV
jgi:hypothetical protein